MSEDIEFYIIFSFISQAKKMDMFTNGIAISVFFFMSDKNACYRE